MKQLELPAREHADGCPAEREETFTRPEGVVVVRCIDCGGQATYDRGAIEEGNEDA
ncbi:MAG: hypothetical protein WDZ37_05495 [Solirubrobacterales bacterium]